MEEGVLGLDSAGEKALYELPWKIRFQSHVEMSCLPSPPARALGQGQAP